MRILVIARKLRRGGVNLYPIYTWRCVAGLWSSGYDVGLQKNIINETDPKGDEEFLELGKPKCRGFKSFQPHHFI
jgi:hypothetical protein